MTRFDISFGIFNVQSNGVFFPGVVIYQEALHQLELYVWVSSNFGKRSSNPLLFSISTHVEYR